MDLEWHACLCVRCGEYSVSWVIFACHYPSIFFYHTITPEYQHYFTGRTQPRNTTPYAKFISALAGVGNNPCFLEHLGADTNMSQGSPHATQRQGQTPINTWQRSLIRLTTFQAISKQVWKACSHYNIVFRKKKKMHTLQLSCWSVKCSKSKKLPSMSKFLINRWILTCVPFSQPECFAVLTENCSHNITLFIISKQISSLTCGDKTTGVFGSWKVLLNVPVWIWVSFPLAFENKTGGGEQNSRTDQFY